MTARLGTSPATSQPPLTPQTKFIDKTARRLGFSGASLADAGFLGDGYLRKLFVNDIAAGDFERWPDAAGRAERRRQQEQDAAEWRAVWQPLSKEEREAKEEADERQRQQEKEEAEKRLVAEELAELDDEYSSPSGVADQLPEGLAVFLRKMSPARRQEREQAILEKVGWEGIGLIDFDPMALAKAAETRAWKYAKEFPANEFDEPEHRKRRCEKWQRKRLRKLQRKAILYVEQAVGAVGGPAVPGRPLYISDYGLSICQAEERRTEEILGGLRLVKKDDPSVQIPMLDLHWKAKAADAAKRRLLIDAHLAKWKSLGWHVCWLTVVLPPQYVAHATNEERRVTGWDTDLGPEEASAKLQEEHHRVLALLREKGVRLNGWWNVQPQQSGVPHRHYVVACETVEDARMVCDEFHKKFDTGTIDEEGQDRGCAAFVLGDHEGGYAPRKGKNGTEETAETVARYAARYSTRYETRPDASDDEESAPEAAGNSEQKRFRGWKKLRGARGMGFLGLDSQRAPLELWDVLWLNSMKEDDRWYRTEDARMSIAMREMRTARKASEDAVAARTTAKAERETLTIVKEARISGDELEAAEAAVAKADADAREAADKAALHGWHAAVAMGLWPDADLDPAELTWLNDTVAEWNQSRWALPEGRERDVDPLPPVPLRERRESVYGIERNEISGAVGVARRFYIPAKKAGKEELFAAAAYAGFLPALKEKLEEKEAETGKRVNPTNVRRLFVIASKEAGFRLSRRPSGVIAGYDLSGEILLRSDDEWVIVDASRAEEMLGETTEEAVALSFSATDPRHCPTDNPREDFRVRSPAPG